MEGGGCRYAHLHLYDGATPVAELSASGAVTAVNTFGANGLVSRTVITNPAAPVTTYYAFDATGSVTQRTDAMGAVLTHFF